jgi:hypothetical protein
MKKFLVLAVVIAVLTVGCSKKNTITDPTGEPTATATATATPTNCVYNTAVSVSSTGSTAGNGTITFSTPTNLVAVGSTLYPIVVEYDYTASLNSSCTLEIEDSYGDIADMVMTLYVGNDIAVTEQLSFIQIMTNTQTPPATKAQICSNVKYIRFKGVYGNLTIKSIKVQ